MGLLFVDQDNNGINDMIIYYILYMTYAVAFILSLYRCHFTILLGENGKNSKVIVFKMLIRRLIVTVACNKYLGGYGSRY